MWVSELRSRLESLLQTFSLEQRDTALEKMFFAYLVGQKNNSTEDGPLQPMKLETFAREESAHEYSKVARQIYAFSTELVEVLSNSIAGSAPTPAFVQYSRERIDNFAKRIINMPTETVEVKEKSVKDDSAHQCDHRHVSSPRSPSPNVNIDVQQLRNILKSKTMRLLKGGNSHNGREVGLILQALRHVARHDEVVMVEKYVLGDLLECSMADTHDSLVCMLIGPTAPPLVIMS